MKKILKNLFGKNAKIHVDEIAVAPDLLLGSAVIIEKGSNANGNYVKFGDGTMICRHAMVAKGTSEVRSPLFSSPSYRWTYPKQFVDNPSVSAFARSGASGVWYANGDEGAGIQYASWRMLNVNNVSADINVNLLAIGRWK